MDGEEVADLLLESRRDASTKDLDGSRKGRARGVVERVDLRRGEVRSLPEWQQPSGVEDLVAVGVSDAGDEPLVLEQVLQLPGMPPDPLSPDVQGQARVVGIRAELPVTESGNRPVETGRQQIDLAHLRRVAIANLDGRVVRGHPVRTPRPRRRSLRSGL